MRQLMRFEIGKMLQKPLVWAALIALAAFVVTMGYNWIAPGYAAISTEENGQRVLIEGFKAIPMAKEIAAAYSGPVTDEKVRAIVETFDMPDAFWEASAIDPSREAYCSHNLMYDTLSSHGFVNPDGSYSGRTIQEELGPLAPEMILGYSTGWECTINLLIYTFLLAGCILVIIVAPVFSEEYTSHMDALILSGIHGRRKCALAKIISSYLIALTGSVLCLALCTLTFLAIHGFAGWDSSVQLGELGIFDKTPFLLNWLQAYGLACIAWLGGMLVLTSIVLVVSALAKGSFSALVIAFTIYALPMFLPWNLLPDNMALFGYLLPITQMQLMKLFRIDLITLGRIRFAPVFLALPITVIALLIGILWSKKGFSHHQVT